MTDFWDLEDRANDISMWLKPPRWRVFRYRRWERTQQPADVQLVLWAALRGEYAQLWKIRP